MYLKLEELSKLYFKRKNEFPNKYKYNNIKVIDNYSVEVNGYDMNVRYIYVNGKYQIYIFIGIDDKLIFHGLYKENSDNIDSEYRNITSDISNLTVAKFIDKYYKILKENFN